MLNQLPWTRTTSDTAEGKRETTRKDSSLTCLQQSCPLITQRRTMLNSKISLFPCLDKIYEFWYCFPLKIKCSALTLQPSFSMSKMHLLQLFIDWGHHLQLQLCFCFLSHRSDFSKLWKKKKEKKKGNLVVACRQKNLCPTPSCHFLWNN